jgi:hypothetical protein
MNFFFAGSSGSNIHFVLVLVLGSLLMFSEKDATALACMVTHVTRAAIGARSVGNERAHDS